MYLDCYTDPPLAGKYVTGRKSAIRSAMRMLEKVDSGQIGIYENGALALGFQGYAIKQPGGSPYFEPAPEDDE